MRRFASIASDHFQGGRSQVKRYGGLPLRLRRQFAQACEPESFGNRKPIAAQQRLAIGSRLIREWNGKNHIVDVIEDGYLWQGRRYRSLSAIARAITGAHWSGPRFFGLNNKRDAA